MLSHTPKKLLPQLRSFLCDKRSRSAFITAALCSVAAYLYYMTNLISNNDMIACTPYGGGTTLTSGRWALMLLTKLMDRLWGGHYNVPTFNVLLALGEMALTSALLIRCLDLKRTVSCVCLTAVTMTIPAFASAVFFSYSIQYYGLAIALMAVSGWLLGKKGLLPFLAAVGAGAVSLGIYQAYLPFLATLLLLCLIRQCKDPNLPTKEILKNGCKYALALIAAYGTYYLILRVILALSGSSLSGYQSIDTMGNLYFPGLWTAWKEFFLLPFRQPYFGFNATTVISIGILCCYLVSLLCLLFSRRSTWSRGLLTALFLLCLPFAANATHFLAADSVQYTRMFLGLIGIFYLPIVLTEHTDFSKEKLRPLLSATLAAVLLLCSANYAWQSNGNYMSVAYSNRKAENYFNSMFTRIRSTEGFRQELPIVHIGSRISEEAMKDNWILPPFAYTARMGALSQLNQYSRDQIILNYLGYSWRPITPQEADANAALIRDMTCYPDAGSILITEDLILVKLENQ